MDKLLSAATFKLDTFTVHLIWNISIWAGDTVIAIKSFSNNGVWISTESW
jgi:hypothetical protein